MKRRCWILGALIVGCAGGASPELAAQATLSPAPAPQTESPLLNFRLPVFNEFGNRVWDLRAAAVRQLGDERERFELTTVHLRILEGDPEGTLEAELFAPVAIVDQPARTVAGKGQLHVIGRDVELFGNDWICYADTKSIVVERDVVIVFNANLGNILR